MLLAEESSGVLIAVLADDGITIPSAVLYAALAIAWTALSGVVVKLYTDLGIARDKSESMKQAALEAINNYAAAINEQREKEGKPPVKKRPKTVPESKSPPTKDGIWTGEMHDLRDYMLDLNAAAGIKPRTGETVEGAGGQSETAELAKQQGHLGKGVAILAEEVKVVAEKQAKLAKQEPEHGEGKS